MATASLGRLTLDLVAQIGQFVEPMNTAERKAKESTDKMGKSFTNFKEKMESSLDGTQISSSIDIVVSKFEDLRGGIFTAGAALAGISAGGVVAFANQTIAAGNEIKKFSTLANASTHDFQFYAKGAETAGFSLEQFGQINKDVLDRLGEASRGEGEMMDFFERIAPKIGVAIEQFKNLSGPQALQAYYNGLQKANLSHAEQITYMEQLANDASLLIPLLKNGGEGFDKWGQAAERANAIMSDEMIENLAIAKENLRYLDLQWQGLQTTLINGSVPAIQAVSSNMDVISNTALISSAFLVGSYIPAVVGGTRALVADSVAKVSNAASSRAKVLADYEVARSNLAATAAMVQAMGATNAQTAAMMNNARAAYQQAAAVKASSIASTGLLGALGGPVGIGITVASIAAGYLLMRDNSAEATAELERQTAVASQTKDQLLALDGAQKRAAQDDLKTAFESQNKALNDLDQKFNSAVISIQNYAAQNQVSYAALDKVRDISNQVRQGLISQEDAIKQLNSLYFVTPEQIREVSDLSNQYEEQRAKTQTTADAQAVYGTKVTLAGNAASNAAGSVDHNTNALDSNAASALGAAAAQSEYMQKLQQSATKTATINKLIGKGYKVDEAKAFTDAYFENGKKITAEDVKLIRYNQAQEAKLQASMDAVTKARQAASKKPKSVVKSSKSDTSTAKREEAQLAQTRLAIQMQYGDAEKKLQLRYDEEKAKIEEAYAKDKTNQKLYLNKAKEAYDLDVKAYQAAQKEKYDSTKNDLLGEMANAQDAIALSGVASKFGKNSYQYQVAGLNVSSKQAKSGEFDDYTNNVNQINKDYDAPDEAQKRYELLELAKATHLEKMRALDADYNASSKQLVLDQYQQQLDMWQGLLSSGQNTFSQLTQSVKDSAGEQSTAYRVMLAGQQAFSIASSMVAAWTAYTQAFADPSAMTLPQKFAGAASVMAALAPALATISSVTMKGFATGGSITGKGTGTSDDIPIWASNGEYMMKAAAVAKLGIGNLDYMNATGNLPGKFADGGLIQDAPKLAESPKYVGREQTAQSQKIMNNLRVIMVKDENEAKDMLYSSDGEKAFLYHMKRNRNKL
jgi:hypothetical protein